MEYHIRYLSYCRSHNILLNTPVDSIKYKRWLEDQRDQWSQETNNQPFKGEWSKIQRQLFDNWLEDRYGVKRKSLKRISM